LRGKESREKKKSRGRSCLAIGVDALPTHVFGRRKGSQKKMKGAEGGGKK